MANNNVPDDLQNMCRLCLSTSTLVSIFDHRLQPKENMAEVIKVTTGVEITPEDDISHMLCEKCFHVTIKMFKFRRISIMNDMELKEKRAAKRKAMHKSVRTILAKYPKLVLPAETLKSNLAPIVTLETNLTKVFAEEASLPTSITTSREEQQPQMLELESRGEHDQAPVEEKEENLEPTDRKRSLSCEPPSPKKPRHESSTGPSVEDREPLFTVTSVSQLNFVCDLCGAILHNNKRLKRHRSLHMRCNLCKKQFTSVALAKDHGDVCTIKQILTNLPKVLLKRCDRDKEITEKYPNAFKVFDVVEISDDEDSDCVVEVPLSNLTPTQARSSVSPTKTHSPPGTSKNAEIDNNTPSTISNTPMNSTEDMTPDKSRTEHLGVFSIKTLPEKSENVSNADEQKTSTVYISKEARRRLSSAKTARMKSLKEFRRKSFSGKTLTKSIKDTPKFADVCERILISDQPEKTVTSAEPTTVELEGMNVSKIAALKSMVVQSGERSELSKNSNEKIINSSVALNESITNKSELTSKNRDNPDITKTSKNPSSQYSISDKSKEPILITQSKAAITDEPEMQDILAVYTKNSVTNQSNIERTTKEIIGLIESVEASGKNVPGNSKGMFITANSSGSFGRVYLPPNFYNRTYVSNKTDNTRATSAKVSEVVQSKSSTTNNSKETLIPEKPKGLTNNDKSKEMSTNSLLKGPYATEKPGTSSGASANVIANSKKLANTDKPKLTSVGIIASSETSTTNVSKSTSMPLTLNIGPTTTVNPERKSAGISRSTRVEKPGNASESTTKESSISDKLEELTSTEKSVRMSPGMSLLDKSRKIDNPEVSSGLSTINASNSSSSPEKPKPKGMSTGTFISSELKIIENIKVPSGSSRIDKSNIIFVLNKPTELMNNEKSERTSAGISKASSESTTNKSNAIPTPVRPEELTTTEKSEEMPAGISKTIETSNISSGSSTTNESNVNPTTEVPEEQKTTLKSQGISISDKSKTIGKSKVSSGQSTVKKLKLVSILRNPEKLVAASKTPENISLSDKSKDIGKDKISSESSTTNETKETSLSESCKGAPITYNPRTGVVPSGESKGSAKSVLSSETSISEQCKGITTNDKSVGSSETNPIPEKHQLVTINNIERTENADASESNKSKESAISEKKISGTEGNSEGTSNNDKAKEETEKDEIAKKKQKRKKNCDENTSDIKKQKTNVSEKERIVNSSVKKTFRPNIVLDDEFDLEANAESDDVACLKNLLNRLKNKKEKKVAQVQTETPCNSKIERMKDGNYLFEMKNLANHLTFSNIKVNIAHADSISLKYIYEPSYVKKYKVKLPPKARMLFPSDVSKEKKNQADFTVSNATSGQSLTKSGKSTTKSGTPMTKLYTPVSVMSTKKSNYCLNEVLKSKTARLLNKCTCSKCRFITMTPTDKSNPVDENNSSIPEPNFGMPTTTSTYCLNEALKSNPANMLKKCTCINCQPIPMTPTAKSNPVDRNDSSTSNNSNVSNILNPTILLQFEQQAIGPKVVISPSNVLPVYTQRSNKQGPFANSAITTSSSINVSNNNQSSVTTSQNMTSTSYNVPNNNQSLVTNSQNMTSTSCNVPNNNQSSVTTSQNMTTASYDIPNYQSLLKHLGNMTSTQKNLPGNNQGLMTTSQSMTSNHINLQNNHQGLISRQSIPSSNNIQNNHQVLITRQNMTSSSMNVQNNHQGLMTSSPINVQNNHQGLMTSSPINVQNNHQGLMTSSSINVQNNHQGLMTSSSINVQNNHQVLITRQNMTSSSMNVQNNHQGLMTSSPINVQNNHQGLMTSSSINVQNNNQGLLTSSPVNVQNNHQGLMTSSPINVQNNHQGLMTSSPINVQNNNQGLIPTSQSMPSRFINVSTMHGGMMQSNMQRPSEYFIINNAMSNANYNGDLMTSPVLLATNQMTQNHNQTFYNNVCYNGQLMSFPYNVSHQVSRVAGPSRLTRVMVPNQAPVVAVPHQVQQMEPRPSTSVQFTPLTPQIPPRPIQTVAQNNQPRNEVFMVPKPPRLKRITNVVKTVDSDKVPVNSQQPQCSSYIRVRNLADLK